MSAPAPRDYVEPARGYRGLWIVAAIFVVGFGVDLTLGVHGALTHLPGWLGGAVIVLGVYWLLLRAVRASKSLHVEPAQVRVGDDTVERADITASHVGVDDELPVLGWPTGMPRGMHGVTLRLTDDRQVVVPTHDPHRLRAALGHGADALPPDDRLVHAATDDDLESLGEIEQRAGAIFAVAGLDLPDADAVPDYTTVEFAAIFVCGAPPVAFVHVTEVDGAAHLREIAVLPGRMRRGIGSALVQRALGWAREQGYAAMTLTTYADVPWNAPFYAAHGFVEIPAVTPELVAIRDDERARGLDDVGRRIVMRNDFGTTPG